MAFLVAAGVYVPAGRIDRRVVAAAWAAPATAGRCAVAGDDEDAVTMAVAAASSALSAAPDPTPPRAVLFATSSPPLQDVAHAVIVATALGLPEGTDARDVSGGATSGLDALLTACDAVDAGGTERALVVVANRTDAAPGSSGEQQRGDAAVALLLSSAPGRAEIVGFGASRNVAMSGWRPASHRYERVFEPRLESAPGQLDAAVSAATAALEEAEVGTAALSAVGVAAPVAVSRRVVSALGAADATQLNGVSSSIGDTGPVDPLLRIVEAAERCDSEGVAVIVAAGQGATAVVCRVVEPLDPVLEPALSPSYDLEGYAQLAERRAAYDLPPDLEALNASPVAYWRAQRTVLRREARCCGACGFVQYPPGRRCGSCGAAGPQQAQRLATDGEVYTFTNDHLVRGRYTNRAQTRCVVDLDSGGRLYTDMTDVAADAVRIGMPVELVLRRRGTRDAFPNYGWKARPKDVGHAHT